MANEPTDDKIEKASADELRVMIKDFQNNSKVKDQQLGAQQEEM